MGVPIGGGGRGMRALRDWLTTIQNGLSPEMVCEMLFASELLRTVSAMVGSFASV